MKIASRPILTTSLATLLLLGGGTSCNVFDPLSNPGGDEQLLSKARACLDQADYECALEAYGEMSSDQADVKASEEAYTLLTQHGGGFKGFATSFGTSPDGKGLSLLANQMVSGAGEARRLAIHQAYKKHELINISNSPGLKNLVRFLGATALAGEILAEIAGEDGVFKASDFVTSPSTCNLTVCSNPATYDPCGAGTTPLSTASTAGNIVTETPSGTAPTMDQLYTAVNEASSALTALGGETGADFGKLLGGQVDAPSSQPGGFDVPARCFRAGLIDQKVGT